jgi:hypothetical protein
MTLHGYVDTDWASNINDRKSTSSFVFMLADGAISWSSKKQGVVALSSTESEYIAGAHAAKEATWLRQLLSNLGHGMSLPMLLHINSQSMITIAKNPEFHDQTKHIDIHYHYLRQKYESDEIALDYTLTHSQPANVLTKGLGCEKHDQFRFWMGMHNVD